MERLVIDPETGEIITVIKDGDRIIRANSVEKAKEFEKIPADESFTKLYHKIIPALADCKLSAAELMVFIHLATHLRYMSNVAKYPNGKFVTRSSLQKDLKLSEITVKRAVSSLTKVGLIVEASTMDGKVFIVNPYVVMVGDKVNRTVFDLFRKSKWARW